MAKAECERLQMEIDKYRFTRRTVLEYSKWGDTQLRQHCGVAASRGQLLVYQLATATEQATRVAEAEK
jgi:hypothetical protein